MDERKKAVQNLKVAKGQIEGIINMIEELPYFDIFILGESESKSSYSPSI